MRWLGAATEAPVGSSDSVSLGGGSSRREGAERSGGATWQPLQLLSVAAPVGPPVVGSGSGCGDRGSGTARDTVAMASASGRGSGAWEVAAVSPVRGWGSSGAGGSGSAREGWLFKWTSYIKGYQRRWFVLSNGLISYYRSKAEMRRSCRGTINLATASITVQGSCNFIISSWSGLTYYLKASSEVERQRWMTALEVAKVKAVRVLAESDESGDEESGDEESGDEESVSQTDKTELQNTLWTLSSKVENLSTCNDLIAKRGTALQRSLSELESLRLPAESNEKIEQVNERATLLRITTNAMINACRDFIMLAQTHSKKWQYERDQRIRLEETLVQLATQHNDLERAYREAMGLPAHPSGSAGPGED